ncbi:hypothetical protein B0H66DRAFT_559463 [Apodospora peruviana]|uniref:Uncharacterized protein n=1 Tax=Apodospora peruviana TaxID=516989 RepID=A0AAE0I833_9PEZI|nr:hypothetical protein B0H66DRAFT_559463 [Apodospora peruviana]
MRFAAWSDRTARLPIAGSVSDLSLSRFARQGPMVLSKSNQTKVFPVVFQKIVRRSLISLIGSEEMTVQLLARNSIDCLAARLDLVPPKTYRDECLSRIHIHWRTPVGSLGQSLQTSSVSDLQSPYTGSAGLFGKLSCEVPGRRTSSH